MKTHYAIIILAYVLSTILIGKASTVEFKEIPGKRTVYSKTFYGGNGKYKTLISLHPIHSRTPEGYLKEIEFSIESDSLTYLNFTGIYKEYVNFEFTGIAATTLTYVGNVGIDDTTEHRYRSAQYWDISAISENVIIDSAKFQLNISYYLSESMNITMYDLENIYPGNLETIYNDCGSGTSFENIGLPLPLYTFKKTFSASSSFCQNLKNSLSKGWFGIGFYSSSETDYGKNAQVGTFDGYLEVFYYNPNIPFEVSVNNDFSGGFYKVIIQGDTIKRTVPDILYMFHGDQAALLAVDQDYENAFRVFDYWLKPGNEPDLNNPIYITVNQNVSYIWYTKKRFDLSINTKIIDGGSGGYLLVNKIEQDVPYVEYVWENDSVYLEAPYAQSIIGSNCYFLNWSDGIIDRQRLITPEHHTSLQANYKANLRTSQPENGNALNQRRVISANGYWYMIYESGGDIWLTYSDNNGQTWQNEKRINFRQGKAKNPTLSNIFTFASNPNDAERFVIGWLEQNEAGYYKLHLQTMRFGMYHFGWYNYSDDDRDMSHRLIEWPILPTARPIVELVQEGNNVRLYTAFETGGTIEVGRILFDGNGYNSVEDLYYASAFSSMWSQWLFPPRPEPESEFPVLIHQPYVYGNPARLFLYYSEFSEESGLHLTQQNLFTSPPIKQYLNLPQYTDYILSLQGAISEGSGVLGLVAQTTPAEGNPRVAFYKKYLNDTQPSLVSTFVGMNSPTIMCENQSGYASFQSEIFMRSNAGNWYRTTGFSDPVYITNQATGSYCRENVPLNNRAAVFTRTNVSPTRLQFYQGTGTLEKIESMPTDIKILTFGKNQKKTLTTLILDFSGSRMSYVDTVLNINTLGVVRYHSAASNQTIVSQPAQFISPIAVEIIRNGNSILSFMATAWNTLTTQNLNGIQNGDLLIFRSFQIVSDKWGYVEFNIHEGTLTEDAEFEDRSLAQEDVKIPIEIYPNPFNPVTTLRLSLPEPAHVQIEIYNILGQKVMTLFNSVGNKGVNLYRFDGNDLGSGIYIYRITVDNKIYLGRLLLMK